MGICIAALVIAGIVMSITGESSSGTFATRTGGISGGTITAAGILTLAAVLAGILLSAFGKNKHKKKKKKKKK